jgi:opacity protein-like surface antigen
MKSKLIAALAAAMMSAGTASANIMNVTATRTVAPGIDWTGAFGAAGAT